MDTHRYNAVEIASPVHKILTNDIEVLTKIK